MQYILTEEEYNDLTAKASAANSLAKELKHTKAKYHEVKSKYDRLLVYGVSINNEKLKLK